MGHARPARQQCCRWRVNARWPAAYQPVRAPCRGPENRSRHGRVLRRSRGHRSSAKCRLASPDQASYEIDLPWRDLLKNWWFRDAAAAGEKVEITTLRRLIDVAFVEPA